MKFTVHKKVLAKVKGKLKKTKPATLSTEKQNHIAKTDTVSAKELEVTEATIEERKLFGFLHIKRKKTLAVIGVISAIFIFLGITGIGLYGYRWENNYATSVTKYVPYPIAMVNGQFISYYSYLEHLNMLKNYQTNFKKVDFKTKEGKKQLETMRQETMDTLVDNKIVSAEAKKQKVKIDQKELDDSYAQLIKSNGGEKTFAEVLKKYYGVTVAEFKEDVYKDRLLRQKVMQNFSAADGLNQESRKKAEEVLAKVKAGEDFQALAKKYSQDSTAANGGDLGTFGKGKMVPEFEKAAFVLKANEVSGLVKTVYGYHIIKVTEVKGDQIHAYHILIKTKDFQTWLDDAIKKAKVRLFVKL
ncbi:MAG: peptidylprolyl isomerase [bacterium]